MIIGLLAYLKIDVTSTMAENASECTEYHGFFYYRIEQFFLELQQFGIERTIPIFHFFEFTCF